MVFASDSALMMPSDSRIDEKGIEMARNLVRKAWATALAVTALTAIAVAGAGPAAAADTGSPSLQDECSWAPWDWDDCII
ncbi:hypothetical protein ACM01_46115 [Streptomyces viridochromogenes]|uniref:Uncharacterized protein n=1 Tax=Streptomyces viridochromogenes TaxID=1938 RepID=A0A0J7YS06_STRVR|nr:hypothetical protein ACM01_46115 [Streptomyces viridochromogenes]KOG24462.1 hypothetical protein ADK36_08050 [Streptomyces viridochromogenes]KOG24625.1 hypothetical protein ADK35_10660 [Streptomyces viridochromogenes]